MEKSAIPKTGVKPRIFYADMLRFLAISAVIVLHCSSDYVMQYGELPNTVWWTGTVFNGISRFCIPLFVMLSGAFLLKPGKYITLKELFGKRMMKILLPLFFWSIIYVCWNTYNSEEGWDGFSWKESLQTFTEGPVAYHLWFLYMMTGIYLIYPVINAFIGYAKDVDLKYFLIVCFIANSFLFIINKFWGWTIGIDFNNFTGYIGYFVLGYYLNTRIFSAVQFKFFVGCLIAGILAVVLVPWALYHFNKELVSEFTESDFTPDVILLSSGLFVVVKYSLQNVHPKKWLFKIINSIGVDAFGIYLVHVLVMEYIFNDERSYSNTLTMNPAWGIPLQTIIVLLISFVIVKLIKLIPFFNKVIG